MISTMKSNLKMNSYHGMVTGLPSKVLFQLRIQQSKKFEISRKEKLKAER